MAFGVILRSNSFASSATAFAPARQSAAVLQDKATLLLLLPRLLQQLPHSPGLFNFGDCSFDFHVMLNPDRFWSGNL